MAISVELGPGIRFTAASRSRNRSGVTQRRRRTSSSSIMAIWAAGPPKAVVPRRRKTNATSRKLACGPAGAASGTPCGGDGLELDLELPMELPPTEEGGKRQRAAGSQILYAPTPLSGIGEASRKTGASRRAIMTRAAPFSTHCVPRGSTHSPIQRKGLAQAAIYRTCRALVFPLCGAMILVRKVAFRRKRRLLGEETE